MAKSIVVEGGAMRGIFAAGVLDAFLQENYLPFDFSVGVSAGATNLIGYLSGDFGRNRKVITEYATRPEFINPRAAFSKHGHVCNVRWLWETSFSEVPLNTADYFKAKRRLFTVSTEVESGKPHYCVISEDNIHQAFTASCAIPLVFREFPELNGMAMTDGGVSDSIPVEFAYQQGARDITVVLSRPVGYAMRESRTPWLSRWLLREHPRLCDAIATRYQRYNKSLAFIKEPPKDCRVRVIAPQQGFPVGRFTRDLNRLNAGYQQGLQQGIRHVKESY